MDHLKSQLVIDFAQYSDAGVKAENQDTVGARIPEGSPLANKGIAIAIADGVSSSQAARQASQTAISGFLTDYYATPDTWRTGHSAVQVIQSLNRYLWAQSQNSARQQGHLTTFSALILKGDTAFSFHVGDSRIYRLREGVLEQLTRDHCQRIDKSTTYLTRALGADPVLDIDIDTHATQEGDLFLLTTDGIHDAVPPSEFTAIIKNPNADSETMVAQLAESAKLHNSTDNLSVQACRVINRGTPSPSDAVTTLCRLPFPPLMEAGHKLDGLSIKKIIHESERSQVYLVETSEGAPLVMKTPSVSYSDDPAYIERFVMESWIGNRIQNPNVVRVVQPKTTRSHLYYLTEYIPGPTLKTLIKQRAPIDVGDATELTEQIIKGLRAFHRKDTLHQDLKPDNLVMGQRGLIVIDFGACSVAGVAEIGAPFQRDTILGTLDYSAPEYRYGGTKSQKSDQFSLAVILYEMLTNKKPYGEAYAKALNIKQFQKLKYRPATHHNPLIPIWLDRAIEKALSIHPNGRYTALSEFLNDIKRPNPNWTSPRDQPLIETNPLLVWQLIAAAGWLTAILAWLLK